MEEDRNRSLKTLATEDEVGSVDMGQKRVGFSSFFSVTSVG